MESENKDKNKPQSNKLNGYELTRAWFDFAFENTDQVSPNHTALYLWLCELYNRLGGIEKIGVPTVATMATLGIKNHKTYKKVFDDLLSWKLIDLIQKSRNQFTANIIKLNIATVKNTEALNNAIKLAMVKNTEADESCLGKIAHSTVDSTAHSTVDSTVDIIKYPNTESSKLLNPEGDKSPGPKSLFNSLKDIFKNEYKNQFNADYYFEGGKDGRNLKQLIDRITHSLKSSKIEPTDENIINTFHFILKNHGDKFLTQKFTISNFNSQYNGIISGIKGKNGGKGATDGDCLDILATHFGSNS